MDSYTLSTSDVSSLIDKLLTTKDPAVVGLRRILKKKHEEGTSYPFKPLVFDDFATAQVGKKIFSDEERHLLELEKRVQLLSKELANQKLSAQAAIKESLAKGRTEGLAAGTLAGTAKAQTEYNAQVSLIQKKISTVLSGITSRQQEVLNNAHHTTARLACEIARKIIHSELSIRTDIVLEVVKKAITYISDRERIVVRVAKGDLENVSKNREFWMPVNENLKHIAIESDDRIGAGGCIVESNSGEADAQLGTQFKELTELVERVWADSFAATAAAASVPAVVDTPAAIQPASPSA